jgi:hypothetical protein
MYILLTKPDQIQQAGLTESVRTLTHPLNHTPAEVIRRECGKKIEVMKRRGRIKR